MKTKNDLVPAIATYPGEIIMDELKAIGMSQLELAGLIGMEQTQLNEIIRGKRALNADLAILLEKVLGIDASYWLETQKNYELDLARIDKKNQAKIQVIEEWNIWKKEVPVPYFKKHKHLKGIPAEDISTVKQIYNVKHVEEMAQLYASPMLAHYKKSNSDKVDKINIIGWSQLIAYLGAKQKISAFQPKSKNEVINKLREIILKNKHVVERSTKLLASVGIKLVIHKNPEKCPVDGVCMWSGANPLIGLSLRYTRLDHFAFTLFHELAHVYLHLVGNPNAAFMDDLDAFAKNKDTKEIEANHFASNALIPEKAWEVFLTHEQRLQDHFAIEFANSIGIHPAIVKGRLKHEFKSYAIRTRIENELN